MTPGAVRPVHAADAAFTQFIASLWPEAQAAGVSRATFDAPMSHDSMKMGWTGTLDQLEAYLAKP